MSQNLSLTLAAGDYEIVRPLKDGTVAPDGVDLNVLTDMDSTTRHWRMLRGEEFDIAELSMSSYLMSADRDGPFTALPVFLHRRFRHGFIFINTEAGINEPKDLIGRKIGVKTFQATAILWMRGILESEYGVPHTDVEWVAELDEDVEFTPAPGLKMSKSPGGKSVENMLAEGEVDAVLHPDLIDPFLEGDPRVGRLFPDYAGEERAYFAKTGIFPIMHVTALKKTLVEEHPWLVVNLMQAFEKAKQMAYRRMANPRIVPLAWYRTYQEEEAELLGPDPWEYGLTDSNRHNMETAIAYSQACGLIGSKLSVDDIFIEGSTGRGRGDRKRI